MKYSILRIFFARENFVIVIIHLFFEDILCLRRFSDRDNIFQFCAQERLAAYTARHSGRNRMAEITRMKRTLKVLQCYDDNNNYDDKVDDNNNADYRDHSQKENPQVFA